MLMQLAMSIVRAAQLRPGEAMALDGLGGDPTPSAAAGGLQDVLHKTSCRLMFAHLIGSWGAELVFPQRLVWASLQPIAASRQSARPLQATLRAPLPPADDSSPKALLCARGALANAAQGFATLPSIAGSDPQVPPSLSAPAAAAVAAGSAAPAAGAANQCVEVWQPGCRLTLGCKVQSS